MSLPESFARLDNISKHPAFSHHIRSLFYEGDVLQKYGNRRAWEKEVWGPSIRAYPKMPPPEATDRDKRAYRREMKKFADEPQHQYSEYELQKGWEAYLDMKDIQVDLHNKCNEKEIVRHAIARMSRLESITLSFEETLRTQTESMEDAFSKALTPPYGDGRDAEGYGGCAQLICLLLGVETAGVKLKHLDVAYIGWRFLEAHDDVFNRLKKSFHHLQKLTLWLTVGDEERHLSMLEGASPCSKYLKNGRFRDLIISAPDLREFDIHIDSSNEVYMITLANAVGTFTWPHLTRITLRIIETTQDDLLHFFRRHAGTLKTVNLEAIILSEGSWIPILQAIRQLLVLNSVNFEDTLISDEPEEYWLLGSGPGSLRKILAEYVLHGGECPLLDDTYRGVDPAKAIYW
ncbi:hypothetical protein MMC12_003863 [Toensbergia leucococca]|nr:hypothetical protein [Toensbergia leucococca]